MLKPSCVRLARRRSPLLSRVMVAPGSVGEPHDLAVVVGGRSLAHVEHLLAHGPLEGGLELEALALALLVVGGDALGRLGGDVLDAVDVVDDLGVAERQRRRRGRCDASSSKWPAPQPLQIRTVLVGSRRIGVARPAWPSESSARTTR